MRISFCLFLPFELSFVSFCFHFDLLPFVFTSICFHFDLLSQGYVRYSFATYVFLLNGNPEKRWEGMLLKLKFTLFLLPLRKLPSFSGAIECLAIYRKVCFIEHLRNYRKYLCETWTDGRLWLEVYYRNFLWAFYGLDISSKPLFDFEKVGITPRQSLLAIWKVKPNKKAYLIFQNNKKLKANNE